MPTILYSYSWFGIEKRRRRKKEEVPKVPFKVHIYIFQWLYVTSHSTSTKRKEKQITTTVRKLSSFQIAVAGLKREPQSVRIAKICSTKNFHYGNVMLLIYIRSIEIYILDWSGNSFNRQQQQTQPNRLINSHWLAVDRDKRSKERKRWETKRKRKIGNE